MNTSRSKWIMLTLDEHQFRVTWNVWKVNTSILLESLGADGVMLKDTPDNRSLYIGERR